MRLIGTAAAACAAAALVTVPAHADRVEFTGGGRELCVLDALDADGSGAMSGTLGAPPTPVPGGSASARMVCALHFGSDGHHDVPDAVTVTGPVTTSGVVAVPPAPIAYTYSFNTWVCARIEVTGGPTYYYDEEFGWYTDPTFARCSLAVQQDSPGTAPVVHCTNLSGSLTYSAAPTLAGGPTAWTMSLAFDCTGSPELAGHYSLSFTGVGNESCYPGGTGSASYSGTSTNSPTVTGSATYVGGTFNGYALHGSLYDSVGTPYSAYFQPLFPQSTACPPASMRPVTDGLAIIGVGF